MLTCKQSHEIREHKYVDFIKLQGSIWTPSFEFLIKQKGEYSLRKGCSYWNKSDAHDTETREVKGCSIGQEQSWKKSSNVLISINS